MPSHTLLKSFQQHLVLEASWIVNGRHYGRTSNAWLKKMDDNIATIRPIFEKTYALPSLAPRTLFHAKNQLVSQLRDRRRHDVDSALARVLLGVC